MNNDFSNTMDLDIFVSQAADASYKILTGKSSLTEVYDTNDKFIALFFDPFTTKLDGLVVIQNLIDYYEEIENYEYCAELTNLKLSVTNGTKWISELLWK
jgi:hypothetical protein